MTIIIACASIGMVAVSNLSRDMNSDLKMQAEIFMDKVFSDTKYEKDFSDKDYDFSGIRIERTIIEYKKQKRIRILMVEAFSITNRKIGEMKELIFVEP